ncbi:MAG: aquaporin family protein [Rhizobiaceae bacterium]|nr:aquaporin family protein [Rhizobiaceae bacterium]
MTDLPRRLAAEALGTAFLVAAIVGSGIMAERLTQDMALALLCNTLATGAMLVVIVTVLGPVSGAHFNPAVTLVMAVRREIAAADAAFYALAQVAGGIAGTLVSHVMFHQPALQAGIHARSGGTLWFAEAVATFGLIAVILAGRRANAAAMPWLVGLYITSAYWFTASTSFANPAVTIARSLTASFSGIRPVDAPAFIIAQLTGALIAAMLMGWLLAPRTQARRTTSADARRA